VDINPAFVQTTDEQFIISAFKLIFYEMEPYEGKVTFPKMESFCISMPVNERLENTDRIREFWNGLFASRTEAGATPLTVQTIEMHIIPFIERESVKARCMLKMEAAYNADPM